MEHGIALGDIQAAGCHVADNQGAVLACDGSMDRGEWRFLLGSFLVHKMR